MPSGIKKSAGTFALDVINTFTGGWLQSSLLEISEVLFLEVKRISEENAMNNAHQNQRLTPEQEAILNEQRLFEAMHPRLKKKDKMPSAATKSKAQIAHVHKNLMQMNKGTPVDERVRRIRAAWPKEIKVTGSGKMSNLMIDNDSSVAFDIDLCLTIVTKPVKDPFIISYIAELPPEHSNDFLCKTIEVRKFKCSQFISAPMLPQGGPVNRFPTVRYDE